MLASPIDVDYYIFKSVKIPGDFGHFLVLWMMFKYETSIDLNYTYIDLFKRFAMMNSIVSNSNASSINTDYYRQMLAINMSNPDNSMPLTYYQP